MPEYSGRASGKRWNMIRDTIMERYERRVEFFMELLTEDGFPPFTEPLTERQQYDKLVAWYLAGDERFWKNPDAEAALQMFEARFGPRPPLSPYSQPYPRIL